MIFRTDRRTLPWEVIWYIIFEWENAPSFWKSKLSLGFYKLHILKWRYKNTCYMWNFWPNGNTGNYTCKVEHILLNYRFLWKYSWPLKPGILPGPPLPWVLAQASQKSWWSPGTAEPDNSPCTSPSFGE